jgi:hypothetical protein
LNRRTLPDDTQSHKALLGKGKPGIKKETNSTNGEENILKKLVMKIHIPHMDQYYRNRPNPDDSDIEHSIIVIV